MLRSEEERLRALKIVVPLLVFATLLRSLGCAATSTSTEESAGGGGGHSTGGISGLGGVAGTGGTTGAGSAAGSTGDDDPERELRSMTLPGFPHDIDIYAVAGANRALVMLHGGAGENHRSATSLGLNGNDGPPTSESVDWTWLEDNRVVVFFPQGQSLASEPNAYNWSNRVMSSGEDDVAFLQDLAGYIRSTYEVSAVYLAGHSNGGMMTHRMWCESSTTFDAYASIAGPGSQYYLDDATLCAPVVAKPYLGIVGSADNVLQVAGNWEAPTWEIRPFLVSSAASAYVDPVLTGAWHEYELRTQQVCGATPPIANPVSTGAIDEWSACSAALQLHRVNGAGHPISEMDAASGSRMLDTLFSFFDGP